MSTLDYHEFMRTVSGIGTLLQAMEREREKARREKQAEEQRREHLTAIKQFKGNIVIGSQNRFKCNAEDAEFEEV